MSTLDPPDTCVPRDVIDIIRHLERNKAEYEEKEAKISLQDAFSLYFRDEELDDFKCEKCSHTKVVIKKKLAKLPRVLIMHLKRYQIQAIVTEVPVEKPNELDFESDQVAAEPKMTTITSYNLVKNDSAIRIPRLVTLKDVIANDIPVDTPRKAAPVQKLEAMPEESATASEAEAKENQNKDEGLVKVLEEATTGSDAMVVSPSEEKLVEAINKPYKSHFTPSSPVTRSSLRPLREKNSRPTTPTASPRQSTSGPAVLTLNLRNTMSERLN